MNVNGVFFPFHFCFSLFSLKFHYIMLHCRNKIYNTIAYYFRGFYRFYAICISCLKYILKWAQSGTRLTDSVKNKTPSSHQASPELLAAKHFSKPDADHPLWAHFTFTPSSYRYKTLFCWKAKQRLVPLHVHRKLIPYWYYSPFMNPVLLVTLKKKESYLSCSLIHEGSPQRVALMIVFLSNYVSVAFCRR